jgi:hypothetical protein
MEGRAIILIFECGLFQRAARRVMNEIGLSRAPGTLPCFTRKMKVFSPSFAF